MLNYEMLPRDLLNAGCNCLSAQALILPREFRSILLEELRTTSTDPAYYPGSGGRCQAMALYYKNLGKGRMIEFDASRSYDPKGSSLDEWFVNPSVVECGVVIPKAEALAL